MGNQIQQIQPQESMRNRQIGPAKIVNYNSMG